MKNLLFLVIIFCLITPIFGFGQSFPSGTIPFFDYPEELLNPSRNTSQTPTPTASDIFNFGSETTSTSPQETYEVTKPQTTADVFRQAELFNPANGLPAGINEQISETFTPNNPQPDQPFTIRIESFSTDLNRADISWEINGDLYSAGKGLVVESFRAPVAGDVLVISLTIFTVEGNAISRTYTVAPAKVDLYFEADTYTPPFYKGKSMYTHQSNLTVHAFPYISEDGRFLNRNELSYVWEVDNRVIQDKSGYGKSSFAYNSGLLSQEVKISVTVSSVGNPSVAEADIFIDPKDPDILLYENHPLYGLIMKNIVDNFYTLTTSDVSITAIPLFFSTSARTSPQIEYSWRLNGQNLDIFDNVSEIAFRNSKNEDGEAQIRVQAKHRNNILQSVGVSGTLIFNKLSDFIDTAGADLFF